MLSTGDGVAQDIEEAVRFYYLAAAQGHATAQFRLGAMFSEGLFVAQDKAEAERFYRLAAAQGHATAQLYLNARKW
jgi:TPR repeat protein